MRKYSGFTLFLIFIIVFISHSSLSGQSRIPGDPINWLQVTKGNELGGIDPVIVVFFQVPESHTGPIYFGIRDPEGNEISPDQDMDGPPWAAGDTTTAYHLFGGEGCYTDPSARLVSYGTETTAAGHLTAGAPAIEALSYDYDGNETIASVKNAFADNTWVYFEPVYATDGEKVGSDYFFRLVIDASGSTDNLKNAFQLIASYTNAANPTEITQIKAFSYSWCVNFRRTDANTWDFYPLVPDTRSNGTAITGTDELDIFIHDSDAAGPYVLSDIGATLIDNASEPTGGFVQTLWSSNTDGLTNYLLDPLNPDKVNGTWHLAYPTAGGSQDENPLEIYAENTGDPGVPLRIYTDFYRPKQAYRIKAITDPADTDTVRRVTLQIVDSNGNAVPYVRNIVITNSSPVNCVLSPAATTVTTNSDGFYTFTCTDLVDETVTLTFASDGAAVPDRLSNTEPQGINDVVTLVYNTGTLPTLVSSGPDLNPITEGDAPAGIGFTLTDTDGGNITAANGIRIAIPPTVNAAFDTSINLSSAIGGAALSKIKTATSVYENSRTIFIDVTDDFAPGDSITLAGMALTSANSASTGDFVLSYSGSAGPYNILDSRDTDGAGTNDILINGIGVPYIWNGSTSSTFSTNTNWAGGTAPTLNDGTEKVIIPNVSSTGGTNPVIPAYNFKEFHVDEGAVPTLSGNIDVTTVFRNDGTLRLTGSIVFGEAGADAFDSNPTLGDVELDGSGNITYSVLDDLTITSGDWVFTISQPEITVNGHVTLNGTSVDFNFKPFHLYGNWTRNSGTILDGGLAGGALYLVGTGPSTIRGSSTLFRLESTVPGKNIYFESGSTQTLDRLVMKGDGLSDIVLRGTSASTWTIDMNSLIQDLSYVDVDWGTAITNTISSDFSTIGANCVNWVDSGVKSTTWTGGAGDFLVTSGANWDLGVPNAGDTVYITGVNPPVLAADWVLTGSPVYINAGGSLNLGSFNLTCGTINNAGDMYLTAGSVLTAGGITTDAINTDSGTVHYSGGGTGLDWGNNYHNLTITNGAWTLDAALTVNGVLTVEGGTLDGNTRVMNIYDDILLTGGALNLAANLTVYRDFLSSGGTFTQTAGTTTFNGGTQTISGNHTWFNFAHNSDNSTLIFTDGTTQTVNGNFTVQGSAGNFITLTGSALAGWDIDILGIIDIDFADISYSTAAAVAANGPYDAMNSQSSSGNNVNWAIFSGPTKNYTWQGDDGTNPTVWSVGENWDTGSKPPAGANVTIPAAAANPDPVLDEDVSLVNLTIEAGTTLSTMGYDLTVTGTFSNLGVLELTGIPGEVITITTMDTDSGLVRYEDGGADGTISFNGAAPDLFNLEINDGGAGRSYALSGNLTIGGSLTMTSGTLTGAAQSLTVTGNAVLNSNITFTGAAALAFNGGVSLLTGTVTSANGSIGISGGSANITLTGQLDAGTGSVTINAGVFEIHGDGDAAFDLRADTIILGTTSTWIGATNPIETASPGVCDLQLPAGDRTIRISHTGAVTPNFGADHTSLLPFELVATGALTLPANRNISTATTDITLQGSTLTMAAGTGQLITTTGNISLTATTGGLNLEHDLVTDGAAGNVTLTAYGAITQTQPITANLLTAETRDDAGANIILDTAGNSVVSVNLQSRNTADTLNDTGDLSYIDSGAFVLTGAATLGNLSLIGGGAITQTGALSAVNLTALTVLDGGALITLDHTGNNVSTADLRSRNTANTINDGGDLIFHDADDFILAGAATTGNLTLSAGGAITQSGALSASLLTAKTTLDGGALITLDQAANNAVTVNLRSRNTADGADAAGNISYVDINDFTLAYGVTGGNITLSSGGNITQSGIILTSGLSMTATDFINGGFGISTAGNVTLNLSAPVPTAMTNTWIFNGTTTLTISGNPISMNSVQLGDGSAGGSLTLTSTQDINANVTALNNGATALNLGGQTVTLGGNLILTNLDTLTAAGSTLIMDGGAAQTLTSNGLSLNNLTINGAGVTATDNLTLTGNLTLTAGNMDINGNNLAVTGIFSNNTNLLLTGAGGQTVSFGTMDTDSGTVTFDGAGTTLAGLTDFYNLTMTGAGVRTFPAAVNVYKNLDTSGVTAAQNLSANTTLLTFRNDGLSTGLFTPPASAANFTFYDMVNETSNVLTAAGDMVIARNWTMNGSFVHGGFGVDFTTTTATAIDGNTNFNDFTCTAAGKTITMTAGDTHTINGVLTLTGTNAAIPTSLVTLTSTANWTFNHLGTESVDYAAIEYGQVTGSDIDASNSVDVGLTCDTVSPGWIFASKTVTWDGSTNTDWFTGANWDWGYIPNNTDNVIIADVANQPVIDPADPNVTTNNLTINAGATSSLEVGNGRSLTINGTFTNNADLIRSGTATVSKTDPLQGRTIYRNTGGNIQEYGAVDYWNLRIENTMTQTTVIGIGGALEITGTLNTNGNGLTVTGNITGAGGTLASSGGETVDANGSISVAAVTSAGAAQYFAGDDFTPGAFTAGTSTVTLDGATAASLGGLTYHNLVLNKSAAGDTVDSAAGLTIGAGGLFTMTRGTWNAGAFTHTVAGNWNSSGVNFNLNATGSTVALTGGSITIATGAGEGFNHLNINGACTLGSALEVGGNLTIGVTGSLTQTLNRAITLDGNFINNGTFDAQSGTVEMTTGGDISGTMNGGGLTNNFYNLLISGGANTTSSNVTVRNTTQITGGSLNTSGDVFITGPLTLNGGNLTSAALTVNGAALITSGTLLLNNGSTANVTGVTTVNGGTLDDQGDFNTAGLTVSSGTFTAGNGVGDTLTVTGALDVSAAGTLNGLGDMTVNGNSTIQTGGTLNMTGPIDFNGNVTLNTGTSTFNGNAMAITVSGNWTESAAVFVGGTSMVTFDGGASVIDATNPFNNLTIACLATLGSGFTVNDDLLITAAGNLTATGSAAINAAGSWTNSGSFDAVNGTVTLTGAGAISGMNGTNDFFNLTITGGAHTTSNNLVVSNNLIISGGSLDTSGDAVTSGTLTLSGGDMTNGTSLVVNPGNMVINNAASSFTGGGTLTLNSGNLSITAGDFTPSGAVNITAGNLAASSAGTMAVSANIDVGGTSTFSGGTFTAGNGFYLDSNGLITVSAGTLQTLGLLRADGGLTINGTGTLNGGTVGTDALSVTGTLTLAAAGDLTGAGNLSVTGNTNQTGGTLTSTGTIDFNGNVNLTGGSFTGGARTITVSGDWDDTAAVFDLGTSLVTFDGTGPNDINSNSTPFYDLTITTDTTLSSHIAISNNLSVSGAGTDLSSTTQNITVTGNTVLTGTSQILVSGTGILTANGNTTIGAGCTLSLGNGASSLGNAPADIITNNGILTSTGTGNITIGGVYTGAAGVLTGNGVGNPQWDFQSDASFGGVNMNGDPVLFSTAGTHAVSLSGASSFGLVSLDTDEIVNLSGAGTFTAVTLDIDTVADNGNGIFDAGSTNFAIGTLDNGGTFRLDGNQAVQTITTFDTNSGWLEFYGAGVLLDKPYQSLLWNLHISGGDATLGQNIRVQGTGNDYYTVGNDYDDEGVFITGGASLDIDTYILTINEALSIAANPAPFPALGAGLFNGGTGTGEVKFTGGGNGYINGDITFHRLTCSYLANPAIGHIADASVSSKILYFNLFDTITIDSTGYLTLTGEHPAPPATIPLTAVIDTGTNYLSLVPTSPPGAFEYWNLNLQSGAQSFMENVCAWYSNASSNPFVLQTNVYVFDCPGWLEYVLVLNSATEDSDNNGKIDRIVCTLGVGVLQGAGAYSGFEASVPGYDIIGYEDGTATDNFRILLQEKPYLDTDATPTWRIVTNTTLYDNATGTKLVVIPPYTADNSSTQTPTDNAAPVIGYTLAVPGNNQLFIHFSEPVERGVGVSPLLTDFNFGGIAPASAIGLTPVTVSGTGYKEVLVDFDADLDMDDCLNGTVTVTAALQDMATTPVLMNLGLARNNAHNGTDILAGPTFDGPVEPLWAVDRTTASSSGSGTGVINEFDGSQHLKDQDITLQAHLSTDIPFASLGGSPIELRFVQNPAYVNGNGLWMDNGHDSTAPFILEDDWSGLVPFVLPSASINSVNGTEDATNNQVWTFNLSEADIINSADLSFLFYLPTLDRYTARIDDHTAGDWYRRFSPWSFGIHNIVDQGRGVSILNNVINPLKGEEAILYYNLEKAGMISVQVFDLAGGLVEILHRGRQDAGEYSLVWNGTNRSNNPVARGIYFVRIVGPSLDEIRKILVIK